MDGSKALTSCPCCGTSTKQETLFRMHFGPHPCAVRRCAYCGLVYKDYVPAGGNLTALYATDYVHFRDLGGAPDERDRHSAADKLAQCRALLGPRQRARLLDVGCGRGGFVRLAQEAGYDAFGVDPFLPRGLESERLRQGTPADLEAGTFDVVVMLNVAEHLTAPRETFEQVRRVLAPGGVLLLTCPFGDSLARRFHRDRWSHMALDEHLLFWTPRSLRHMTQAVGFHGSSRARVLGAPFPYGRQPAPAPASPTRSAATGAPRRTLQSEVWRLARAIQRSPQLTNAVRQALMRTRAGDYLEYVVRVD